MQWSQAVEDAESFGILRDNLLLEYKATSTYENALYSKEIVLDYNFELTLVVTSNYHMRRTKLAFDRVYRNTNVLITYVPYDFESIRRDNREGYEKLFVNEYKKWVGAYFLYHDGVPTPLREILEENREMILGLVLETQGERLS